MSSARHRFTRATHDPPRKTTDPDATEIISLSRPDPRPRATSRAPPAHRTDLMTIYETNFQFKIILR